MEHYRGQKIYIIKTNSERIGEKSSSNISISPYQNKTKVDAIEDAVKDLEKATVGRIPQFNIDEEVIEKLMEIFKTNADAYTKMRIPNNKG